MLLYRLYTSGSASTKSPAYMAFSLMVLDGVCCYVSVLCFFVMDYSFELEYSCIRCKMGILILLGMIIKCIE